MRSVFYVAVAVAILARSSVVAAFTNADDSRLMSKTPPDFAVNAVISSDPRKRFLRVTDPEDGTLIAADEERGGKIGSLKAIIAKLDEQNLNHVAEILKDVKQIHALNTLKAAQERGKISKEDFEAANTILSLLK
ncbi:Secreted RxLR effector peptide protein [Phytophthora palmivora]|uniref:RxLR effector protein n=1 Tax=Phytophthora palmivora TaxID=4796 RepID=A0A2P4YDJ6_9STRA|nr:Secreted RxLR effector peptide protein [Phytophthora palmivora]